MGRAGLPQGKSELLACGVPAYVFPESAARAVGAVIRYSEWLRRPFVRTPEAWDLAASVTGVREIIRRVRARGEKKLSEAEALYVLKAYGIPTVAERLATSPAEAALFADEIGWPVALKVVSPQIIHKSDVGGVRLNLTNEIDVTTAYREIVASARRSNPRAQISGVLVQKQVIAGRELIAGITRQPGFGPLVMVGLGGIFVEALNDVSFRLAPIHSLDAYEMLSEIRGSAILDSLRGMPAADREAVIDVLVRVARLGADFPEIEELDINPIVVSASGAVAVDARVLLTSPISSPVDTVALRSRDVLEAS
jgi:acetyltransferase